MEIEVVNLKATIIALFNQVAEDFAEASLILLVHLTQQVQYMYVAITRNQIVCVLVQSERILLPVVLEVNLCRFLGLLGPKERDRASNLNMREEASPNLYDHFRLDKICNIAVFINTTGVESCASARYTPPRNEREPGRLGEERLGLVGTAIALDDRHEPTVRNTLHPEVLQHVEIPDEVSTRHQIGAVVLLFEPILMSHAQVGVV